MDECCIYFIINNTCIKHNRLQNRVCNRFFFFVRAALTEYFIITVRSILKYATGPWMKFLPRGYLYWFAEIEKKNAVLLYRFENLHYPRS